MLSALSFPISSSKARGWNPAVNKGLQLHLISLSGKVPGGKLFLIETEAFLLIMIILQLDGLLAKAVLFNSLHSCAYFLFKYLSKIFSAQIIKFCRRICVLKTNIEYFQWLITKRCFFKLSCYHCTWYSFVPSKNNLLILIVLLILVPTSLFSNLFPLNAHSGRMFMNKCL